MSIPQLKDQPGVTVGLSGFALIGDFERAIDECFQQNDFRHERLTIDLSDVTYVEIPTLQSIIALALSRQRQGLITLLRVPGGEAGKRARDYLRRIEFPKAVSLALKTRFVNFVAPEDHHYFKGLGGDSHSLGFSFSPRQRAWRRYQSEGTAPRVDEGLEAEEFFPFTTWCLPEYQEKGRVADEALDAWSVQTVVSVLDKHLRVSPEAADLSVNSTPRRWQSSGQYVASRIVFEAMINAIRHPGATYIQTSSLLNKYRPGIYWEEAQKRHFTVTFWDDGASMYDTLKSAIHEGLSVRHHYPKRFETNYDLNLVDDNTGKQFSQIISSAETPQKDTPDHVLLLSTIFPGVTRDVTGKGHRVHPELAISEPELATQGMGLFALVRTAVDLFGGSIAARSGSYFMSIKAGSKKQTMVRYQVKIVKKRSSSPPFLGNMLTVRLPLRLPSEPSRA
jgi:hypothetical protein